MSILYSREEFITFLMKRTNNNKKKKQREFHFRDTKTKNLGARSPAKPVIALLLIRRINEGVRQWAVKDGYINKSVLKETDRHQSPTLMGNSEERRVFGLLHQGGCREGSPISFRLETSARTVEKLIHL